MDDHYHTLSLRLYEILDWLGASEEMRSKYRERSIVHEIVENMRSNLCEDEPIPIYLLGSRCEGTTTTGLDSDIDYLFCFCIPVVEKTSDPSHRGLSYLMVTDETTQPGYCKLQVVWNNVSMYQPDMPTVNTWEPDQYGRMCLPHLHKIDEEFREINGPALTITTGVFGRVDQDYVMALKSLHTPSFAKSWVTRLTSCNRLNQTQIKMMKEFGCFFVGKKHPSSQNGTIEWRMSFSLQERELMSSLNPTQHKCYTLLKMIKKDIICKRVIESISSYHCKTCLLYAIEKTPCEFWTRRNLLECLLVCIKLLLYWVKKQYCPNYFIPEENMFDRIKPRTLQQVQSILEDMVEHWCRFLWSISCDDICNLMSNVLFGRGPSLIRIKYNNGKALLMYMELNRYIRSNALSSFNHCNRVSASNTIVELHQIQRHLLRTDCIGDHTEKETRQAIRYFSPHICLRIAQCIASIMLTTIDTYRLRTLFGWFKYYIEESKNCDTISSNLIVASYCLQSDQDDICENILLQCETSLKSHVVSVCGCYEATKLYQNEAVNELKGMLCSQYIPYTEFARTCTTGCLVFLPHQANLLPPALHYEMYRSVYTPPDSRDDTKYFWFDWMVVDSKVYLYFMQYVLYSKTNKPVYKQNAVDNLLNVINTDRNLGHGETAWNLLGWIFKQENKIQRAMECFLISWKIRPNHNAAKWHLLELIHCISSFNSECCNSVLK